MYITVIETPEFERCCKDVALSDEDKTAMINDLAVNPLQGVSLGSGIRKWRYAPKGQGKRGGYRVVYFYASQLNKPIYLLTVFGKKDKTNLTPKETIALRQLGKTLMEI